jgi:hypothetical protein
MHSPKFTNKTKEWAKRYIPAEVLGTIGALIAAWLVYSHTHSYVAAAGSGWLGEGMGFYGYFITAELLFNNQQYQRYSPIRRIPKMIAVASTNLLVEFAPAEIVDNFFIRPFAMYVAPQYIHPYPIGFLVGKFSADLLFYLFAIAGYEARKRWLH